MFRCLTLQALPPSRRRFLGSIGLNLLFPGFGKRRILRNAFRGCGGKGLKSIVAIEGEHSGRVESYDHNGANVSCENAFGESVRYVSGEIGWVNLDNAFGTLQVYFTEAYLQGGRADVSLDVAFGKTVLYVPSNWKVNLSLDKAFGSIRESGHTISPVLNSAPLMRLKVNQ